MQTKRTGQNSPKSMY